MAGFTLAAKIPGGPGVLPAGYDLVRGEERLLLLGNYEAGRTRHGMGLYNRYPDNFQGALAMAVASTTPVLCEGGFQRPQRLGTPIARQFCRLCTVIMLVPPDARADACERRGRDLGDESYSTHLARVTATAERMRAQGSALIQLSDRDVALRAVAGLLGVSVDESLPAPSATSA
jgi:hypothetical protein